MMRLSDFMHFDNGGKFSSQGDWIHSARTISTYELILVTHGTVYLEENGIRHILHANDYIILHPQISHGGYRVSTGAVGFYWLHFHSEAPFSLPFTGTAPNPEILIQNARQLLQIHQSSGYPKQTADHMLYVLLSELTVQREQTKPQNALAVRTLEYIRAHAYQPLTVSQVAENMGFHPDYLSRVIKAYCGTSLNKEIIASRLQHAKWLLQTTDYTIRRIAYELGYEDANLFEKFFTYHAELTPTEYRNAFSNLHTNHK